MQRSVIGGQWPVKQGVELKIRIFILLASCFSLLLSGCGNSITGSDSGGSNTQLSSLHKGGPDCSQSGCHPGFGAGGTVYDGAAGLNPLSGVTVKGDDFAGIGVMVLGVTDSLGNFHYDHELNGLFNMSVDGGATWSGPHDLPSDKGCNNCHKFPNPSNGASGRIF